MDGLGFDALARAVSTGASRRQAVRLLAAGALAGLLPPRARAAPARQGDECAPGLTYCDEQPNWAPAGCYDLSSDYLHCGSCMSQCPSAGPAEMACIGGACVVTGCGDLTDCTGNLDCTDLGFDPNNCGACGVVCDSGVCETGVCTQGGCAAGFWDCEGNGSCTSFLDDPNHCGDCGTVCASGVCDGGFCTPLGCEPGLVACPYSIHFGPAGCYDLATDPNRCGSCENSCGGAGSRTIQECIEGSCVATGCLDGFVDCTGNLDCTPILDDPNNCGACGVVCASGVCVAGGCTGEETTCAAGLTYCPALPPYAASALGVPAGCTDLTTDYSNCGACGASCQPADPIAMDCIGGQCTQIGCVLGWTDCGNLDCRHLPNDPLNCGACGNVCESGVCEGLACVPADTTCAAGLTYCPVRSDGNPAGCYDLSADRDRCGSCELSCPVGIPAACRGGQCVCREGLTDCSGLSDPAPGELTCVDLVSDPDHCGECGNACARGICEAGACAQQAAQTAAEEAAPTTTTAPAAGGSDDGQEQGPATGAEENRGARTPRAKGAAKEERQGEAADRADASPSSDAVLAWPFDPEAGQWTIVQGYRAGGADETSPSEGDDFVRFALELAVCPEERIDAAAGACDLGEAEQEPDWDREATQGSPVHSPVDGTVAWTEGESSCLGVAVDIAGHPGYRVALFNVEGDLERGQAVKRGKRIGKVAKRGCARGDRVRMILYTYKLQTEAGDDPVAEREGAPFAGEWGIAGCDYPDDGGTADQYRGKLVPCPAEDAAASS